MTALIWIILLLLLAALLLLIDVFVPSSGVLLILAIAAAISAVVTGFRSDPYLGMGTLILLLFATPWLVYLAIKIWPHTPIGRKVIIKPPRSANDVLPDSALIREVRGLVGMVGVTHTDMLPSGSILIRGKRYDATSQGILIEKGMKVKVMMIEMGRLVVVPSNEEIDALPPIATAANWQDSNRVEEDLLDRPIEELGLDSLDDSVTK